MSTRKNYRRIYEQHHGPIPVDNYGRTYEVHHLDGDCTNDSIDNLVCISIDEHYQIHYGQKDWGACYAIKTRMKHTAKEISDLASLREKENWKNGVHNFQKPELKKKNAKINKKRLADGTHNILTLNSKRIENGTHNFLGSNLQKTRHRNGEHPTQIKASCIHCKAEVQLASLGRWHGDKCKG